jgi:hypothetical protein
VRDDRLVETYAPDWAEILAVASRARLANTHPDAQSWLQAKVRQPPDDWELRAPYTVPGLVWTVESDTCATGRPNAPHNIAYDHFWHEFVYRQPADEAELVAIMSADSEEVFSCYRFDGLQRWTTTALDGWFNTTHDVVVGWLRYQLSTETDLELVEGLNEAHVYLTSDAFREYVGALRSILSAGGTSRWRRR